MPWKQVRRLGPWIGGIAGLLLLSWVLSKIDFAEMLRVLALANPWPLLLLPLFIVLEQGLRAVKWRQILHPLQPVATWRLFGAIMTGNLISHTLSLGTGPLARGWLIARLENLRLITVLASMVTDRLIDAVVFLGFAIVTLLFFRFPGQTDLTRTGLNLGVWVGVSGLALILALLLVWKHRPPGAGRWLESALRRLPERIRTPLVHLAQAGAAGVVLPREPSRQMILFASALAIKLIAVLHFYWAALAFGVRLDAMAYVFLMVFFGFLVVVASQLNFIGGFLAGAVFALQALGVGTERALAMTLAVQAVTILTLAVFGTASLWIYGFSLRDLPRLGKRNGAHSKDRDAFFTDSS